MSLCDSPDNFTPKYGVTLLIRIVCGRKQQKHQTIGVSVRGPNNNSLNNRCQRSSFAANTLTDAGSYPNVASVPVA